MATARTKRSESNGAAELLAGAARLAGAEMAEAPGEVLTITPPNIKEVVFRIVGISPLVTNKFSEKARAMMKAAQEAGSQGRSKRKREPKDFAACFEAAIHRSTEGWPGIPAGAFRSAMIDACRLVGFKMTIAKLAVFVREDGYDEDGTDLVRIHGKTEAEPFYDERPVRNESGVADIRARPRWQPGWRCDVRVEVDLDQFSVRDVLNLLRRAGQQVGIGEGRPGSKNSHGMGWGRFDVESEVSATESEVNTDGQ